MEAGMVIAVGASGIFGGMIAAIIAVAAGLPLVAGLAIYALVGTLAATSVILICALRASPEKTTADPAAEATQPA